MVGDRGLRQGYLVDKMDILADFMVRVLLGLKPVSVLATVLNALGSYRHVMRSALLHMEILPAFCINSCPYAECFGNLLNESVQRQNVVEHTGLVDF